MWIVISKIVIFIFNFKRLNNMFAYNIFNDQWEDTNKPMTQKRRSHACLLIDEEEIIVTGGYDYDNGNVYLKSSEIYNLKQRRWRPGPDLPIGIAKAQFVKAKPGFKYLGYFIGGRDGPRRSSAIYGLTKDMQRYEKIGYLKRPRNFPSAFVLSESISEKCF